MLVSIDELNRLKACEATLYAYQDVKGLCPICEKAMLCYGLICSNCGYDISISVEKWKQIHEDKKLIKEINYEKFNKRIY